MAKQYAKHAVFYERIGGNFPAQRTKYGVQRWLLKSDTGDPDVEKLVAYDTGGREINVIPFTTVFESADGVTDWSVSKQQEAPEFPIKLDTSINQNPAGGEFKDWEGGVRKHTDGRVMHVADDGGMYPMPQESGEAERDVSGVLTGNTVA